MPMALLTALVASAAEIQHSCGPCSTGVQEFVSAAHPKAGRTSDKVTFHTYQHMYGIFLAPLRNRATPVKLFEIGLGCNMKYGAGASVELWHALLPGLELWSAEYDVACAQKAKGSLRQHVHVVTGDQGNASTVEGWIAASGGHFDAVIDDGSHRNRDILTSFALLWPHVKPGGFYFLEDLQVGRDASVQSAGGPAVSDVLQEWMDVLLGTSRQREEGTRRLSSAPPLPVDVESIYCQREACVLAKTCDGTNRATRGSCAQARTRIERRRLCD